jgi:hypothetical protein
LNLFLLGQRVVGLLADAVRAADPPPSFHPDPPPSHAGQSDVQWATTRTDAVETTTTVPIPSSPLPSIAQAVFASEQSLLRQLLAPTPEANLRRLLNYM